MRVRLFYTVGCHLCELAEMTLPTVPELVVERMDIADDEALLERYGLRIPVLARLSDGAELDWPFDAERVNQFLAEV
ncbi:MAG: glutaredoxin family protein [Gammaproteobacteria bacterium]|nr:glutaredoxin family protein [Gammaproteobacteria bacterium]